MLTTVWTPSMSKINLARKQVEKCRCFNICFMQRKTRPFEMDEKTELDPFQWLRHSLEMCEAQGHVLTLPELE